MRLAAMALTLTAASGLSHPAIAQEIFRDDPKRPVAQVSHDLGIQPEQFRSCFAGVSPSPAGQRPTSEKVHANKSVLLSCLQKANPAITNEALDKVMDRYRPGGYEAQAPLIKQAPAHN
jgi:hypothetical protein